MVMGTDTGMAMAMDTAMDMGTMMIVLKRSGREEKKELKNRL